MTSAMDFTDETSTSTVSNSPLFSASTAQFADDFFASLHADEVHAKWDGCTLDIPPGFVANRQIRQCYDSLQ
jgi:hypothetical protein